MVRARLGILETAANRACTALTLLQDILFIRCSTSKVLLAKIMQATLIFPEIHLAVRTSECQKGSTSAESAL